MVDGPSGSGKSTLAARLVAEFGDEAALFSTDHLATWNNPFDWWEALEDGVLSRIAGGQDAVIQVQDWSAGEPVRRPWLVVPAAPILVLEGVSCSRSALGERVSLRIWVEVPDPEQRLERAVARDGEPSRGFLSQWQRDEQDFFAADHTRDRADIVLDPLAW